MSLIRGNPLFKELRKAFRLLEEPFQRHHPASAPTSTIGGAGVTPYRPFLDVQTTPLAKAFGLDNLDDLTGLSSAQIKEAEDGKQYLVEAELPGVAKENLKVEFSDDGKVLHIEGFKGSLPSRQPEGKTAAGGNATSATDGGSNETAVEKTKQDTSLASGWPQESYSYGTFRESFVRP
jgi:HSP20 family molecular chaperone IbpA